MPVPALPDILDLDRFPQPREALREWVELSPRAMDLYRSNPVLAQALAHLACFRRHIPGPPGCFPLTLAERKQREILAWLGFPGAESVVRLFRRIRPEAAAIHELRLLRGALLASPDVLAALGHIRQINAGALALTTRGRLREVVDPALVHEVSMHPDELTACPVADLLTDILYMAGEVLGTTVRYKLPTIRSVVRLHDHLSALCLQKEEQRLATLTRERRRHRGPRGGKHPFPQPPLPGTPDIVALKSDHALVREAKEMGNCLASYRLRVRREPLYLYRVMQPERATLCIKLTHTGFWLMNEIKLRHNAPAAPETESFVRRWLTEAQATSLLRHPM